MNARRKSKRYQKDIKRIGEGVEHLISFFHLLSSMGYSKEQAKETVLDALDFAYKDKEGK